MSYTEPELLGIMAARKLRDGASVFAGVGLPLLAAVLARKMHTPDLMIVVEGGIFDPEMLPGRLPISTNEMRDAHRATMLTGITDTFLYAQRGFLEYGFIGGAQIDRFGNVNTSVIGSVEQPKVKLPGSGGANDIVSLCREVMIVTMHEKRRFVERVDFITSPGFLRGGRSREEAGLHFGQVSQIITNLGLLDFDQQSRAMWLRALHPGVTVAQVQEQTGFELVIPDVIETTQPPTDDELALVRSLDPDRRYLG